MSRFKNDKSDYQRHFRQRRMIKNKIKLFFYTLQKTVGVFFFFLQSKFEIEENISYQLFMMSNSLTYQIYFLFFISVTFYIGPLKSP